MAQLILKFNLLTIFNYYKLIAQMRAALLPAKQAGARSQAAWLNWLSDWRIRQPPFPATYD